MSKHKHHHGHHKKDHKKEHNKCHKKEHKKDHKKDKKLKITVKTLISQAVQPLQTHPTVPVPQAIRIVPDPQAIQSAQAAATQAVLAVQAAAAQAVQIAVAAAAKATQDAQAAQGQAARAQLQTEAMQMQMQRQMQLADEQVAQAKKEAANIKEQAAKEREAQIQVQRLAQENAIFGMRLDNYKERLDRVANPDPQQAAQLLLHLRTIHSLSQQIGQLHDQQHGMYKNLVEKLNQVNQQVTRVVSQKKSQDDVNLKATLDYLSAKIKDLDSQLKGLKAKHSDQNNAKFAKDLQNKKESKVSNKRKFTLMDDTDSVWVGEMPNGEVIEFERAKANPDGNCGFHVIGIDREGVAKRLMEIKDKKEAREFLAPEIMGIFLSNDIRRNRDDFVENKSQPIINMIEDGCKLMDEYERKGYSEDLHNKMKYYCGRKDVYQAYVQGLSNNLWLGHRAAALWAESTNTILYIWQQNKDIKNLTLILRPTSILNPAPATGPQKIHMLFTDNFDHFDLLVEKSAQNDKKQRYELTPYKPVSSSSPSLPSSLSSSLSSSPSLSSSSSPSSSLSSLSSLSSSSSLLLWSPSAASGLLMPALPHHNSQSIKPSKPSESKNNLSDERLLFEQPGETRVMLFSPPPKPAAKPSTASYSNPQPPKVKRSFCVIS